MLINFQTLRTNTCKSVKLGYSVIIWIRFRIPLEIIVKNGDRGSGTQNIKAHKRSFYK